MEHISSHINVIPFVFLRFLFHCYVILMLVLIWTILNHINLRNFCLSYPAGKYNFKFLHSSASQLQKRATYWPLQKSRLFDCDDLALTHVWLVSSANVTGLAAGWSQGTYIVDTTSLNNLSFIDGCCEYCNHYSSDRSSSCLSSPVPQNGAKQFVQ
jgi:hypothetical protein